MILFKKIRYKNLLSTGNVFTEIELDRNRSTLIVGENGAGKSSILDALCFALYGRPFRKVNKGLLVNSINGKGLVVELEFQIGKREYFIRRGIKPNVFEIFQDGNIIDQHSDVKEYQEYLEKNILKLNHKSFSQIVVLGSASFVPFMQLTSQHRREVIEDLLDIQIFSTMNGILKEKISSNKINIQNNSFAMQSAADKIDLYRKHIDEMKQNNDELIVQKQAQIDNINNQVNQSNESITQLQSDIATLLSSIDDQEKVRSRLEKVEKISRQLDNRLEALQREASFFEDHSDCPTCHQGIADGHRTEIITKSNDQITKIEEGKREITQELDSVNNRLQEITKVSSTISSKQTEVSNALVEIRLNQQFVASIQKEIDALNENTNTITDNTEELTNQKKILKAEIEKKQELIKDKQVLDVAAMLLRDTGIKTRIIKQYVPIMNKLINKYLASMDFFVNFELNENFEEKIKSRFRDEFTYDSFSEGEKMRIDLSLLFTWRAIAKLRNSASTNLLIMDEVFDSSLDNSGTDEFLKILETLTNDTNVFIISHKGDTLYDKFHHVIKFEKHKNFSRMA